MTAFQIITLLISGLFLLGAIITVYVKLKIDIAKIEVHILNIQRELNQKEISLIRLEDKNTLEHNNILTHIQNLKR